MNNSAEMQNKVAEDYVDHMIEKVSQEDEKEQELDQRHKEVDEAIEQQKEEIDSKEKPRVVFVLGGPGCGKGTQCSKLVETFGFVHLSAGDLLRDERATEGSEHGELIEKHMVDGTIVPVSITCALLKKAMEKAGWEEKRYLIDGFPRNKDNQAGWSEAMDGITEVSDVLYFELDNETMTARIKKRAETSGRVDDNEKTIAKRLNTF